MTEKTPKENVALALQNLLNMVGQGKFFIFRCLSADLNVLNQESPVNDSYELLVSPDSDKHDFRSLTMSYEEAGILYMVLQSFLERREEANEAAKKYVATLKPAKTKS